MQALRKAVQQTRAVKALPGDFCLEGHSLNGHGTPLRACSLRLCPGKSSEVRLPVTEKLFALMRIDQCIFDCREGVQRAIEKQR